MKKVLKCTLAMFLAIVMVLGVLPLSGLDSFNFIVEANAAFENTWTNTGDQAKDIVEVAKTQLEYVEGSDDDNKYGAAFNHNNDDWCAYFVSWCAKEAGIPDNIIHQQGQASPFSGYFNIPNTHGRSNYFPKPGDLVFYGPDDNGDHYHVGIVETVDSSTGYITTIEGNSGSSANGVYRHTLHYQYSSICCYGIPNYDNTQRTLSLNSNRDYYEPGTEAKISWQASGADSVHLYIYKDGEMWFNGEFYTSETTSKSFTIYNVGHYAFYIVAHYSSGDVESEWKDFDVYNLSVATSKKEYTTGETAMWYFTATGAENLHLYIYKDGAKFFEGEFSPTSTYSRALYSPGHYSFYIVAHFSTGDVESAWNDFDVFIPSVNVDKQKYDIGESVTFTFNCPNADSLHLYIVKDGVKWFEGEFSPSGIYTRYMDSAVNYSGEYCCYIVAHYNTGDFQSNTISYSVNGKYIVSYNGNDGNCSLDNQIKYQDSVLVLSNEIPTKTGYSFTGWNTKPDGTGTSYAPGEEYTENEDLILYAQWSNTDTPHIKIIAPSNRVINYGESIKLYANVTNLPSGAKIKWIVEGSGVSVNISPNGKICTVTSVSSGNVVVKAYIVDANNNIITDENGKQISDSEYFYSDANLWLRIVFFFKKIFKISLTYSKAFKEII